MIELLTTMWDHPDGRFGEIRVIPLDYPGSLGYSGPTQHFLPLPKGIEDVVRLALDYDAAGENVYYGVLPRVEEAGTAEAVVPTTHVLWADVDAKHFDGNKAAALFSLGRANLSPSILVDSGNGWHAYWLLSQRVPFYDASGVMRGLAKAIGGDAVADAPRILRLPGTHNHKSCIHNGITSPTFLPNDTGRMHCKPVRLLHFEPARRYRFSDFDTYAAQPVEHHHSIIPDDPLPFADLPSWLGELIVQGAPQGTRSEMAFKVCVWLLRYGWTEEMIHTLFLSVPNGIGQKMAEMKQEAGDRWLDRTIRKAQEAA